GCVDHPIVLTEAVCNPLYSRQMMSELLFECYGIPTVAYGVDSLFSFYHNNPKNLISSGLIISSGYQCTHILPILEGRLDAKNCKRINLGGSQAAGYLQRLLQLKYPGHLAAITLSRMEEILHEHSYIAEDYVEELQKWRCPDYYENNVHKMQLPFSSKLLGSTLTDGWGGGLRCEALVAELLEDGQMDQFHKALIELNMDSPEELQSYIQKLSAAVEQAKQKILQAEASLEVDVWAVSVDVAKRAGGGAEIGSWVIRTVALGPACFIMLINMSTGHQSMPALGILQVFDEDVTPDLGQLEPSLEDVENINDFEPLFSEETPEVEKPVTTVQPVFNLAAYHQLFVGTERIRAPEIIFQPSLIGEEQAGIAETLQYILDSTQMNVFLTGGNMMYPGMKVRIEKELLEMRPFQSSFQLVVYSMGQEAGQLVPLPPRVAGLVLVKSLITTYPGLSLALHHLDNEDVWITRKEYEEKGGGYLKEHCASNVYVPIRWSPASPALRGFDTEDREGPVVVEEEAEDPGRLRTPHVPAGEPQAVHSWAQGRMRWTVRGEKRFVVDITQYHCMWSCFSSIL
ncbi:hypothetical protein E2I00_004195, partial [Balaenoptera physalus]